MKRSLVAGLGLTLLGAVQLAGCAESGGEECLPGDADCADPIGGVFSSFRRVLAEKAHLDGAGLEVLKAARDVAAGTSRHAVAAE